MMRLTVLSVIAAAAILGAVGCSSVTDTGGDVVISPRSEALGNIYRPTSGGFGMPATMRDGVCNETDISECFSRDVIQKIANDGRLVFRYPDGSTRRYIQR